jgi:phage gp37-like protein
MAYVPIITAVELAIVDRLTRGLGRMVKEVKTYGGEFDDDELDTVVRRFPAAWVTFGGVKRTDPVSTSRAKWKAEAVFVVMVGSRSLRNEQTSRHGGPGQSEIGTNLLVSAVRHLLNEQDMGLPIRNLQPGSIRTLFNTKVRDDAMSVYALEFRTAWVEDTLFLGAFPQGAVEGPLGAVFEQYDGHLDPETPDWKTTLLSYFLKPGTERPADAQDLVDMPQE